MKQVCITKDKRIVVLDIPRYVFVADGKIFVKDGVNEAVEEWITINGAAVPLGKGGEVLGGAGGKFTGQKVGEKTEKPKKNYSFRYDHTINKTRKLRNNGYEIPAGSKVTGVKPIAKGDNVKQASNLTKRYNVSDPSKWQKVRGNVNVKFPNGHVVNREVHYYYHPEVGEVDYKFPRNKKQVGKGAKT